MYVPTSNYRQMRKRSLCRSLGRSVIDSPSPLSPIIGRRAGGGISANHRVNATCCLLLLRRRRSRRRVRVPFGSPLFQIQPVDSARTEEDPSSLLPMKHFTTLAIHSHSANSCIQSSQSVFYSSSLFLTIQSASLATEIITKND